MIECRARYRAYALRSLSIYYIREREQQQRHSFCALRCWRSSYARCRATRRRLFAASDIDGARKRMLPLLRCCRAAAPSSDDARRGCCCCSAANRQRRPQRGATGCAVFFTPLRQHVTPHRPFQPRCHRPSRASAAPTTPMADSVLMAPHAMRLRAQKSAPIVV